MTYQSRVRTPLIALFIAASTFFQAHAYNATDLIAACKNNDYNLATRLLQKKVKPNAADRDGNTCLMHATIRQNNALVQKLLEYGANDRPNNVGDTALIICARLAGKENKKLESIAELLITRVDWVQNRQFINLFSLLFNLNQNDTDINWLNQKSRSALIEAAISGNISIAQMITMYGGKVEIVDNEGNTALTHAAMHGHVEMASFLLSLGAHVEHCNDNNQTALDLAKLNGHQETVAKIKEFRAKMHQENMPTSNNTELITDPKKKMHLQLRALPISEEKREQLKKEIDQASGILGDDSLKSYLNLVFALPWNTSTPDAFNWDGVKQDLNAQHYGLNKAKEEILDYVATLAFNKKGSAQIICLVGPPGVGKTTIAESIARSLGKKYARIAVGGMHDESELRGHRRTYVGAMAGKAIKAMQDTGVNNPVILLDEIDKIGTLSGYQGDPSAALLELLDPEQNKGFKDNYLDIPFDFSKALFITTANNRSKIPAPLRNRMKIIDLPGYSIDEKITIVQHYVVPSHIKKMGWQDKNLTFDRTALELLCTRYATDKGMRETQQHIKTIFAKLAREHLNGNTVDTITATHIKQFLGEPLLGESDAVMQLHKPTDPASMYDAVKNLPIADEYKIKLYAEIDKLDQDGPNDAHNKKHLEYLFSLPWNNKTEDNLDVTHAQNLLNKSHYALDEVKDGILEFISTLSMNKDRSAPILCLYGPPGIGKTSIVTSIATSLGRRHAKIALGGITDQAKLRGISRSYVGGAAGEIIEAIKQSGSSNPVILLDEIDKMGAGAYAALLEILDPEQNATFKDEYLGIPFDLSKVLFVATVNDISEIPWPVRDRMHIISLPGYTPEEKALIVRNHLVHQAKRDCGLTNYDIQFEDGAISLLIDGYTREAGVRHIKRVLKQLLAKTVAYHKISGSLLPATIYISKKMIVDRLGAAPLERVKPIIVNEVGMVNGLYWSPVGGGTLKIEAVLIPRTRGSQGDIKLTGQLQSVMQESANIALSYALSKQKEFGLDIKKLDSHIIHIHVPEGATPKDGPSAGAAFLTAIVSALSNRPVKGHCAMTGELNLRGYVTAIGGVDQKLIGAKQAGITHVFMSEENRTSVDEVAKKGITNGLTITFVKKVDEIINAILL